MLEQLEAELIEVEVMKVEEEREEQEKEESGIKESEADEMWSFVGSKRNQRWLWHAIDRATGKVLAYVFGKRKDEVFLKLKELLQPFGIRKYSGLTH